MAFSAGRKLAQEFELQFVFKTVMKLFAGYRNVTIPCPERKKRRSLPCGLASLAFVVLLAGGCSTSKPGSHPSRPGAGLTEYHMIVAELRKAVATSRQSAQVLAAAPQEEAVVAFQHFNDNVQRLEVGSIKARARADAMEKRGEAYFEEWAEEMSNSTDGSSDRTGKERFAEFRHYFDDILNNSKQVRQVFRPFLDGLRSVSASLGEHPDSSAVAAFRPSLEKVVSNGRLVEESLQQLLATLDKAQDAIRSGAVSPASSGGKP